MEPIFDVSEKRLLARRERAEQDVKDKRSAFEQTLKEYEEQVEEFKEKEVHTTHTLTQRHHVDLLYIKT